MEKKTKLQSHGSDSPAILLVTFPQQVSTIWRVKSSSIKRSQPRSSQWHHTWLRMSGAGWDVPRGAWSVTDRQVDRQGIAYNLYFKALQGVDIRCMKTNLGQIWTGTDKEWKRAWSGQGPKKMEYRQFKPMWGYQNRIWGLIWALHRDYSDTSKSQEH